MNPPDKFRKRRDNRLAAVQFLYLWEMNSSKGLDWSLNQFYRMMEEPVSYYKFTDGLVRGAVEKLGEIDAIIKEHTQNWDFNRIGRADLAILRLAIYELFYQEDVPPIVAINEAIELSKVLSTEDSKRFINGILDKVKLKLNRPLRAPNVAKPVEE